ncbi:MAG: FAD-dependent monooxygenase [Lachnospiraceae bacterium]|nr:FAD-dependent monooxygenase [Lachnospiraceae bacterium]
MIRIRDIKLLAGSGDKELKEETAKILCLDKIYPGNSYPDYGIEPVRRSVDARKKPVVYLVYTVKLLIDEKEEKQILKFLRANTRIARVRKALEKITTEPVAQYVIPECGDIPLKHRPVVVGFGPCGMFAALMLARRGFRPVVIERGSRIDKRTEDVEKFWQGNDLDPDSNVLFGEGGAGTFSDGKLQTLTKDINGRNTFILETFYEHGAPKDITVDSKPHVGTDILRTVVANIREEIISLGGQILFNTKFTGIVTDDAKTKRIAAATVSTSEGVTERIETSVLILCPGHSARDTFEMLYNQGIDMSRKSFAAGFRIVHPQKLVNRWQYGMEDAASLGLPSADYKVTNTASNGRRVYSFCMCPGGYVVNSSSEDGGICVNGMSMSKRDRKYANSAIVAAVSPDDFIQDEVAPDHPLAGMYYQRRIEKEAYKRGDSYIPAQFFEEYAGSFEADNERISRIGDEAVKGRIKHADLRGIFSEDIDEALIESVRKFGYTMEGFDNEGLLLAVESRTSSPVRIERDDDHEANIKGLYPCGEGAGYAGGIVSSAADGLRCAAGIIEKYHLEEA